MNPVPIDIFCQVIDNYGDAGVCWRLASQLAAGQYPVRLWISDLHTLAKLVPSVDSKRLSQHAEGVHILAWPLAEHAAPPSGGIVIEAFGCALPQAYRQAMIGSDCLWINLEYLSAEDWVERCHGLPSPQPNRLCRYFYFPGFTAATGGLLREPSVSTRRPAAARQDPHTRLRMLTGLDTRDWPHDSLSMLLFCYPHAPVSGLQRTLSTLKRPVQLLVPGSVPTQLRSEGSLRLHRIPFVAQKDFDALLRCCDLNLVRGEDSMVRALWARRPLIWQLYPQDDGAHMEKLTAWQRRLALPPPIAALQEAWNRGDADAVAQTLAVALQEPAWQAWRQQAHDCADTLCQQDDLVTRLLAFFQMLRQTG